MPTYSEDKHIRKRLQQLKCTLIFTGWYFWKHIWFYAIWANVLLWGFVPVGLQVDLAIRTGAWNWFASSCTESTINTTRLWRTIRKKRRQRTTVYTLTHIWAKLVRVILKEAANSFTQRTWRRYGTQCCCPWDCCKPKKDPQTSTLLKQKLRRLWAQSSTSRLVGKFATTWWRAIYSTRTPQMGNTRGTLGAFSSPCRTSRQRSTEPTPTGSFTCKYRKGHPWAKQAKAATHYVALFVWISKGSHPWIIEAVKPRSTVVKMWTPESTNFCGLPSVNSVCKVRQMDEEGCTLFCACVLGGSYQSIGWIRDCGRTYVALNIPSDHIKKFSDQGAGCCVELDRELLAAKSLSHEHWVLGQKWGFDKMWR